MSYQGKPMRTISNHTRIVCLAGLIVGILLTAFPGTAAAAAVTMERCTGSWCLASPIAAPHYSGWHAHVRGNNCRGAACSPSINDPQAAWAWTSNGFVRTQLSPNTPGYVAPYRDGWSWIYAASAWYVVSSRDVRVWIPRSRIHGLRYVECGIDPGMTGFQCGWLATYVA